MEIRFRCLHARGVQCGVARSTRFRFSLWKSTLSALFLPHSLSPYPPTHSSISETRTATEKTYVRHTVADSNVSAVCWANSVLGEGARRVYTLNLINTWICAAAAAVHKGRVCVSLIHGHVQNTHTPSITRNARIYSNWITIYSFNRFVRCVCVAVVPPKCANGKITFLWLCCAVVVLDVAVKWMRILIFIEWIR